ncbi:hypothetical protein EI555_006993, partial [Monodon monoceros]
HALLLWLTVVGIHVWIIQKEFVDISKDHNYFAVSVEFAVAWFNSDHEEEHADKLLEVRQPSKSTCQQKWGEEFPAPTAAPFLLKNEGLES